MFGHVYFGAHYFAPNYFGGVGADAVQQPQPLPEQQRRTGVFRPIQPRRVIRGRASVRLPLAVGATARGFIPRQEGVAEATLPLALSVLATGQSIANRGRAVAVIGLAHTASARGCLRLVRPDEEQMLRSLIRSVAEDEDEEQLMLLMLAA